VGVVGPAGVVRRVAVTALLLSTSLAAAAAVVALGVPRTGALRLRDLLGRDARPSAVVPTFATPGGSPAPPAAVGVLQPSRRVVVAGVGGCLVTAGLVGPVAAVLVAVGEAAAHRWWRARRRSRAVDAERRGIVEACSVLAAELRAGRTAAEALRSGAVVATGASQDVLRAGAATAGLGGDVAGALTAMPPDCAVPDVLRSLAACWSVCSATGSGRPAAVDRLEEGLRADQALRQALAAELAGPRATAGLLAVLPVLGLLLAAALGADPLFVLLHTPLGLVCLVTGVGLDALGVLWTNRLVRRAGG
jgi:tight adherence protein B